MMYLTLEEYLNMGGTLDSAVFSRLEYRARKAVKARTGERMPSVLPEDVKHLMFELISLYESEELYRMNGVQSFSNDGVSVSLHSARSDTEMQSSVDDLISLYLSGLTDDDGNALLSLKVSYAY